MTELVISFTVLLLAINCLRLTVSVARLRDDVDRLQSIEAGRIMQEERGSRHDDNKGERDLQGFK